MCEQVSLRGVFILSRIRVSLDTTHGRLTHGKVLGALTVGANFLWTRAGGSSIYRQRARNTTSMVQTVKAPTCLEIAYWRLTPAPGNAFGTSRWFTTTFGITTMPPLRNLSHCGTTGSLLTP